MAELSKADYEAKYGVNSGSARFQDNVSGDIGANDMRDFAIDHKDSLLWKVDNFRGSLAVDVSGASFTIAFGDFSTGSVMIHRVHQASANIGANKTQAFSGEGAGNKFDFVFTMTTGFYIEFPATVFMNSFDGNWNTATKRWTCPETGRYRMHGTYDGANWDIDIYGPRN